MWISGLRGAMAYALAMQARVDFANGPLIMLVSLMYALFTILVQGSVLNPVMVKCQVKQTSAFDLEIAEGEGCFNRFKKRIMQLDSHYACPIFVKDRQAYLERNESIEMSDRPSNALFNSPLRLGQEKEGLRNNKQGPSDAHEEEEEAKTEVDSGKE